MNWGHLVDFKLLAQSLLEAINYALVGYSSCLVYAEAARFRVFELLKLLNELSSKI